MGVKDFNAFIAKIKAEPGKISGAVPGLGTLGHLMLASFNDTMKTEIQIVPYRGSGPALNDALAGMVQLMPDQLPSAMPQIKSGKLIPLCRPPTALARPAQCAHLQGAGLRRTERAGHQLVRHGRAQEHAGPHRQAVAGCGRQGRASARGAKAPEAGRLGHPGPGPVPGPDRRETQRNKALLDKAGVKPE
jgi:hypothetical protein